MNPNPSVANRPLSLAGHLRHAAELLRNKTVDYDWHKTERCNCGVLARIITGMTVMELSCHLNKIPLDADQSVTWRMLAGRGCPITGVPTHKVFAQLHAAGMRYEDYAHLEDQSHPDILNKLHEGFQTTTQRSFCGFKWVSKKPVLVDRKSADSLWCYLDSWAEMIEEYARANPPACDAAEQRLEAIETRPLKPVA